MAIEIQYVSVPDFIRMNNAGEIDLEHSKSNFARLIEIWKDRTSYNVVIDIRKANHKFSPRDVLSLAEIVAKSGLGITNRVAIIYKPPAGFDPVRFFEYIVQRQGLSLQVLEDFEEAMAWLAN